MKNVQTKEHADNTPLRIGSHSTVTLLRGRQSFLTVDQLSVMKIQDGVSNNSSIAALVTSAGHHDNWNTSLANRFKNYLVSFYYSLK
jgi:hypothetical protein